MNFPECSATLIQIETETRPELLKQVKKYITDTFDDIKTVKDFCDTEPEWTSKREMEIQKMRAKSCTDAFFLFLGVNKLKAVMKDTLEGLEKLHHFLGAVERLAVTSLFVFLDTRFPIEGVNTEAVRSVISTARTVSPHLIHFKRDNKAFFLPELDNVDLLVYQLHKYICITKWLCKKMKRVGGGACLNTGGKSVLKQCEALAAEGRRCSVKLLSHFEPKAKSHRTKKRSGVLRCDWLRQLMDRWRGGSTSQSQRSGGGA
ncbi:hypothetical protein SRHO_G00190570 [Serrasalmus rhombeus]